MSLVPRVLVALAVAAPALPQEGAQKNPFSPAPQVDKFHHLIGSFEGEGTYVQQAGTDHQPWTATATGRTVLGGHFVQFDEAIQTSAGPLHFRTLYGWDAESERPAVYWTGSMGVGEMEATWIGENRLVTTGDGREQGVPHADRAVMVIDEDGYTYEAHRLGPTGESFEMVTGEMKRTSREPVAPAEASASSPGEHLADLAPMVGEWEFSGMVNMPGMKMDVTGRETIGWRYGGTVLAGHVEGQPEGSFSADWYISWDPDAGRYRQLFASTMGEISVSSGWMIGDQLVFTESRVADGTPTVSRGVVQLADGGIQKAWAHAISGTDEPVKSFEATYQRVGQAKKALKAGFAPGSCCAKAAAKGETCSHPCCVKATEAGEICERCNGE